MVLRLLRALPGVHDILVTVVRRLIIDRLGTSRGVPGPHDFAVRKAPFVRAGQARALNASKRPLHPAPTFRDDWPKRPSVSVRDELMKIIIFGKTQVDILGMKPEASPR